VLTLENEEASLQTNVHFVGPRPPAPGTVLRRVSQSSLEINLPAAPPSTTVEVLKRAAEVGLDPHEVMSSLQQLFEGPREIATTAPSASNVQNMLPLDDPF
jgi:hypothetical protein